MLLKKDKSVLDTWDSYTIATSDQDLDQVRHFGQYLLTGLSPATVYQVKIGAKNAFGWNYSDEIFVFGTKGSGQQKFTHISFN